MSEDSLSDRNLRRQSGLVLLPGDGISLTSPAMDVVQKISGGQSSAGSLFEITVSPGFDVGAHIHARSEEFFYVLDGVLEMFAFEPAVRTAGGWREWQSSIGERVTRCNPGSVLHVPPGCPHAFSNPGPEPARFLFQSAPPPDQERYFQELVDLFRQEKGPSEGAIDSLRARYDIQQLTPLAPGSWQSSRRQL